MAGIDEIWRVGGAQAIAALAYGTSKIPKVDVITGPGNAWVAEAKRQLYGVVGIDMIAGPSEILVIADKNNPVEWIAADLLSQAEHDPLAQSILITDDENFADAVALEVETQLNDLSTWKTAAESWKNHGAIIVTENLSQAIPIANLLAAEHVELAVANPDEYQKIHRSSRCVLAIGRASSPCQVRSPLAINPRDLKLACARLAAVQALISIRWKGQRQ